MVKVANILFTVKSTERRGIEFKIKGIPDEVAIKFQISLHIFDLSDRLSQNVLSYKLYPDYYKQSKKKIKIFKSVESFLSFSETNEHQFTHIYMYIHII